MKLFSAQTIKNWDADTILQEPISSIHLMERAMKAAFQWLMAHYDISQPVYIFCGKGNNGGDGLTLARILIDNNIHPFIYVLETDLSSTPEFHINLEKLRSMHADIHYVHNSEAIPSVPASAIIVDALFGIGLNRPVQGVAAELITALNQTEATIISIDLPSGLYADESSVNNVVIQATITLTFQIPKLAFFMPENEVFVGQFYVLDIGLSPLFEEQTSSDIHLLLKTDIQSILKPRSKFAHKGNFGHALIAAGSYGKMGAAVLTTRSCLKSGAGRVTALIPLCGIDILQTAVPEAMVRPNEYPHSIHSIPFETDFTVYAIGPGIGMNDGTKYALSQFLKQIGSAPQASFVFDADALNLMGKHPELLKHLPPLSILTPHPLEWERMFGKTENDFERWNMQKQMAKELNCIILLKGHYSMLTTPKGQTFINSTGNPGMATAGSGDVLTGIIAGLLCEGYDPEDAAKAGMYIHGLAGDIMAATVSQPALTAGDIIEGIGKANLQLV